MTEDDAKRVLLVRAVEEEDSSLVLPEVRAEAWRAAGSLEDLGAFSLRRADYLLDRLPRGLARLLAFTLPPPEAAPLFWAAAGALGLFSNVLSVGQRIHVLANPVSALLIWNLAVYAFVAFSALRPRTATPASESTPLQPVLTLVARAGTAWARLRGRRLDPAGTSAPGAATRTRVRFVSDYTAICGPIVLARSARLIHGAAITFALGALAGIYLQGVAFEYRMEWGSTLVSTPEMRAHLAALLFFPARLLLGAGFPDADQLALAATPEGAPAAVWFHVFAISVASIVVAPRAALAFASGARARRMARSLTLPIDEPYWQSIAESPDLHSDHGADKTILSHFSLDADGCTVLASLQAGLVADDIGSTRAGRALDTLGRKKDWFARWRTLVERGFSAFPERERPRILSLDDAEITASSTRVSRGANPFAAELILLELAAFEAYWPFDPKDVGLRDRIGLAPGLQREVRAQALRGAARRLGLPEQEAEALRSALGATTRELSGVWSKVLVGAAAGTALGALTLGVAAPVAAVVVGKTMGAASLLALKAGLAAIGGHLLVGAGLGAAGGSAIVVGGGVILSADVAPSGTSTSAALTPATALLSSAKIEVFLRQIVAKRPEAHGTFFSILEELQASVARLRDDLPAYRRDPAHGTQKIQEREKVIAILSRVAARNERWGKQNVSA